MSLSETMTALMDKARKLTGLTEKISIAQLTSLMDHLDLHVNPNLLDTTTGTSEANKAYPVWSSFFFNKNLVSGTYTFSWRAKAESDTNDGAVRIRIFNSKENVVIPEQHACDAGKAFALTDKLQTYTFHVPDDGRVYQVVVYGASWPHPQTWDVTFYDCKLEVGDLATPLNKVGGVTKAFLSALRRHFRSSLIGGVA